MSDIAHAFPTTQWTVLVQGAYADDPKQRQSALTALGEGYWMPLYAFARRLGYEKQDAEDLTQGFFAYMLERNVLYNASRELGTLRTFLLKLFRRYIGDVRDLHHAQKRGGGALLFSLNIDEGEELITEALIQSDTPETLYDRTWAKSLLRGALSHLASTEAAAGRGTMFTALEPHLSPDGDVDATYADAAAVLGQSPESVRQSVSRLRKKFRDCLRVTIAATLQNPDDARINAELHALKAALLPS